jgi:predicted metal-dependent phosphotriesterase family hydrolase
MERIRTVSGDIEPADLGWCQCHEHLFVADGPSRAVDESLYMDDMDKSLAEAVRYRNAGGSAIVDAQPYGCGRMAENLAAVSDASAVHIVACTGFHKLIFMEDREAFTSRSEESIAELYTSEVMNGMIGRERGRVEARAGLIKCAAVPGWISDGIYHKLFEAAAHAARETGAPVLVHMDPGADAFTVIRFFADRGIEPERLILCHLDRTRYDMGYHREAAQTGAYLEYDTIHRLKYHSDEAEAELIAHMVENGYDDRLLLSMDTTNRRLRSYGADFGLDFILTEFSRLLAQYGVDSEILHTIMVENPRRALAVKIR